MLRHPTRTPSLLITSLGLLTNTFLTFYLLSSALSSESAYKWEPESEWESTSTSASWLFGAVWGGDDGEGGLVGTGWGSKVDGVTLLWVLLIAYFGCAACVCGLGVYGVLKTLPTYIRFYRDFTIASISFTTFFLALATYTSFHGHSRASLCESLSHYPDLLRSLQQSPLLGNLSFELTLSESCEAWLEGAVVVGLAALCLVMAVRLHLLLAVNSYYGYVTRYGGKGVALSPSVTSPIRMGHSRSKSHSHSHSSSHSHSHSPSRSHARASSSSSGSSSSTSTSSSSSSSRTSRSRSNSTPSAPMQRIYLLPSSLTPLPESSNADEPPRMVYAPVPLDSLPIEMQVQAMEVLVQQQQQMSSSERPQPQRTTSMASSGMSHQRHKSHRRRSSSVLTVGQQERKE
ncbi:hypothetical protein NMY22_g5330 [Coprinellus aureogranulatus]|nr:hypothetical protein NMY22_g5330 [Coprinellus aureogranulatus]